MSSLVAPIALYNTQFCSHCISLLHSCCSLYSNLHLYYIIDQIIQVHVNLHLLELISYLSFRISLRLSSSLFTISILYFQCALKIKNLSKIISNQQAFSTALLFLLFFFMSISFLYLLISKGNLYFIATLLPILSILLVCLLTLKSLIHLVYNPFSSSSPIQIPSCISSIYNRISGKQYISCFNLSSISSRIRAIHIRKITSNNHNPYRHLMFVFPGPLVLLLHFYLKVLVFKYSLTFRIHFFPYFIISSFLITSFSFLYSVSSLSYFRSSSPPFFLLLYIFISL